MNDLANDLSYLVNAALGKKEQYTLRTDIDVLIRLAYTNQMQGILFTALVQEDIPEEKKEQLSAAEPLSHNAAGFCGERDGAQI